MKRNRNVFQDLENFLDMLDILYVSGTVNPTAPLPRVVTRCPWCIMEIIIGEEVKLKFKIVEALIGLR